MKNLFFAAFLLLMGMKVLAQTGNVVLYTENGERFYAILNGIRMNDQPVTNLKVQDLNQPGYALKVIFENTALGEMNKNMYTSLGEEAVYAVRKDKKGVYKLVPRSSVPLAQAAPPAPQQQIVVWGAPIVTTGTIGTTTTTTNTGTGGTGTIGTGTTVVVTEQTTTTTGNPTGDNVNMNVTTDGFGMNVTINGTGTGTTGSTGMTTTTTTTTTSGTGGTGTVIANDPVIVNPSPCNMSNFDFEAAKRSIDSKSFEDSKLTIAKQITSKNCLSAAQVKSVMELFSYEQTKLDYAKYAYGFCWERNNYFQVNDAFGYESSIDELDKYISAQH